ncbi:hypothetical protein HAX54_016840 [Datura stramonium]|uniref:histidine kinase n=1 Tax=Datura stramonium TaxID=4076 RepID=A0ABS8ULZ1_DATST|nr:hypothetical protein [Datura stramonium]
MNQSSSKVMPRPVWFCLVLVYDQGQCTRCSTKPLSQEHQICIHVNHLNDGWFGCFNRNFCDANNKSRKKRNAFVALALIKQMEATQQQERKNINKNNAFILANHDLRASLASITGLIELCRTQASPKSELVNYLDLMESCTQCIFLGRAIGELRRILGNLHNAVKFTSEGHVTLRAWVRKPSFDRSCNLAANTTDSSTGCLSCLFSQNNDSSAEVKVLSKVQQDPNCMEFVFELLPANHKQALRLGLGITQLLVRLMGGEIGIVDKQIGEKGTCFRFNIFLIACDKHQAEDHYAVSFNYGRDDDLESQLEEVVLLATRNPM